MKRPLLQFGVSGLFMFTAALAGAMAAIKPSSAAEALIGTGIFVITWIMSVVIIRGATRWVYQSRTSRQGELPKPKCERS